MAANSTYTNYQQYTDAVNRILLDMKTQLDIYRQSPTANPNAVAIREQNLITLVKYVEASKEVIQSMGNARDESYRAGIERGRELAMYEGQQTLSPRWGSKTHYKSTAEKEAARWEHNYRADSKWGDHF